MSVSSVPIEILRKIFSYCNRADQDSVSRVCHRWNDAVQFQLLQQTSLTVSDGCRCKTKLIDEAILQNSNRKYSCFRVDLPNGETDRIKQTLKERLVVCRERFQIEKLFLQGSPNKALVLLFNDHHEWLQNLTFLDVDLLAAEKSNVTVAEMVTLPNLQKLVWDEGAQNYGHGRKMRRTNKGSNAFALNAPKLVFLLVRMSNSGMTCKPRDMLNSRCQDPDVCHMFLPTLELKTGSDLREIVLTGIFNLKQQYIDGSEHILHNLERIVFNYCHNEVVVRICDKCPNLKELVIGNPLEGFMPLQISPALSANLEKLKIVNVFSCLRFVLYGTAVFPKLRDLLLQKVTFDMNQSLSLDAPSLSTFNLRATHFSQLALPHTAQLRTLGIQVLRWNNEDLHPSPNVTELALYKSVQCATEGRLIEKYLKCTPHLTRLKVAFLMPRRSNADFFETMIDLTFVESLPKLEYLSIHKATLYLQHFEKLAGLKSLLLSNCNILSLTSIRTVVALTALEYFRAERVTIVGASHSVFPIQVNERQPPIEIVSVRNDLHETVFNSKNFETEMDRFDSLLENIP